MISSSTKEASQSTQDTINEINDRIEAAVLDRGVDQMRPQQQAASREHIHGRGQLQRVALHAIAVRDRRRCGFETVCPGRRRLSGKTDEPGHQAKEE